MKEYYLGLDLGGTKILTGLADTQGNIITRSRKETEANLGEDKIIANMIETIETVIEKAGVKKEEVKTLGIGSPGPLDAQKGIIIENSNLPWKNVALVERMESALGIKTILKNDANAAALGEKWFGAGRTVDNMVYLTISTGIGGGAVINKELFTGINDNACEIGHTVIDPDGPLCGCGNHGCLESFASGTAIGREAREAAAAGKSKKMLELADNIVEDIDAVICAQAAYQGDQAAREIFEKAGYYLGIGLGNVVNIFNTEMIILGGGVMKASDLFLDQALATMKEIALPGPLEIVTVTEAELGSDIGLMGAIAVAMEDKLMKNE
ncbi:MAG: glucokinase [Halanaerobium sp. 4-GBenrich]|jgi:glucokinase|uniref:Glucokinase n=1 Tax=Halanaerobium congolense TaxID=54121 RepID=A0A1G7G3C7_9FIRM|nr:ROK family protein [Halanaerobium congolense]KXS49218.1 MAG: glucokinase [Halanaerobium sp. T82-1]ODS50500.1 MAG: glucokinase [Halanaerobium sp. 4-GBenrich]PUU91646.1 MAG: glucokinase [Halanaerobium sp.]PTX16710.1 glucokinase [Halanaerobium congolense]PXV64312.1 glucokinase [Halanaerobium congolense]